jgi:glycosyltransferase involved in cell wall biosynthesis
MMISLIICTHNRSRSLRTLLESLEKLDLTGPFTCEAIVVDNNSTDDTRDVVTGISKASPLVIKYAFEANQGLGHARNRGVAEASGDVLAFTDDDCIPETTWARLIAAKFSSESSLAGIGGRVELFDASDQAVTIRRRRETGELQSVRQLFNLIAGCNMAFRRHVFDEAGLFDPGFGAGTRIAACEDTDFLYRAHQKGLTIKYFPDVLVYHNHGRKNDAEVNALHRGYACGRGAFYCKHILLGDRLIMGMAIREVVAMITGVTKTILAGHSIKRHCMVSGGLLTGFVRGLPMFVRRAVTSK